MRNIALKESAINAVLNFSMLVYALAFPCLIGNLLVLTPAIWNPTTLNIFWDVFMINFDQVPGAVDSNIILGRGKKSCCMTFNETLTAVSAPNVNVSGFYGPGAYFAWLITSWTAAISSIANAKCASNNPQMLQLDLESIESSNAGFLIFRLIAVISYPLIACGDIIIRLIRCKIDACITAAVFIVVTSMTILSPMKRLSVQCLGSELFEFLIDQSTFFTNRRLLTLRIARWILIPVVDSVIGEAYSIITALITPYSIITALITPYSLSFIVFFYSGIVGKEWWEKGHLISPYRPWQERVIVFILVQIIFSVVLVTTGSRSFWPVTSASLLDLDQISAVMIAVASLILSRRESIRAHFVKRWKRIGKFVRKEKKEGEEGIPLQVATVSEA